MRVIPTHRQRRPPGHAAHDESLGVFICNRGKAAAMLRHERNRRGQYLFQFGWGRRCNALRLLHPTSYLVRAFFARVRVERDVRGAFVDAYALRRVLIKAWVIEGQSHEYPLATEHER